MGPIETKIQLKIQEHYQPEYLEIFNESQLHHARPGSESHFKMQIVSESFTGMSRLERQRNLHELLKEELQRGLHALSARLLTPNEWSTLSKDQQNFESVGHSTHK